MTASRSRCRTWPDSGSPGGSGDVGGSRVWPGIQEDSAIIVSVGENAVNRRLQLLRYSAWWSSEAHRRYLQALTFRLLDRSLELWLEWRTMRFYVSLTPRRARLGLSKRLGPLSLFMPLLTVHRKRRKR
jgi:hypothetical protein